MDRNTDKWWYDRGYSLGVVETQREAVIPRLVGAWSLLGITVWDPVVGGVFLACYSAFALTDWKDRKAEAEHKRDVHDPGREFEYAED